MKITKEQRDNWEENTKNDEFNKWFKPLVSKKDGTLDVDFMYEVAKRFGVYDEYRKLNPGQQRMNIGNKLRTLLGYNKN